MQYFKAWYRPESEANVLDTDFPDWVVYALDEDDATRQVLDALRRPAPERHYRVHLVGVPDEDAAVVLFARARQSGQALP